MSNTGSSSGLRQIIVLLTLGFLAFVHWLSYAELGGISINESTREYGNLPLQMSLVFIIHGFFLFAIKSSFGVENRIIKFTFIGIAATILFSAISFYTTETLFGTSRLNLFEPVMISIFFVFSLFLYFYPKLKGAIASET